MAVRAGLQDYAYSAMRIVAGLLFMFHGLQKLFGLFGGQAVTLPSQMGLAGVIETVGGILVMIGLFTTPVAFICSGEMAVAYFLAHIPRGFWPIENGGELAALYCFVFLYIAARGAGVWSVDGKRRRPAVEPVPAARVPHDAGESGTGPAMPPPGDQNF